MIEKTDDGQPEDKKLSSQYLSVIEVGGAYAHIFFNLLHFLNLRTLIITDLDTVNRETNGMKCKVSEGTHSSNGCINRWYAGDGEEHPPINEFLRKSTDEKIRNNLRLAYQVPHFDGDACGRSFEDAFMLANPGLFNITGATPLEREDQAWDATSNVDKIDFALKYGIEETAWNVPRYIMEGLRWLAQNLENIPTPDTHQVEVAITEDRQPQIEEIVDA
jgi:putative ATP-dependent endonuclease of OLD family